MYTSYCGRKMMRVPVIEKVNMWKEHFENMAKGKLPSSSIYNIPNQRGAGAVGNSYRANKKIFSVQTGGAAEATETIISPVKGALDQTKSEIQNKQKTIKDTDIENNLSSTKSISRGRTKKSSNITAKKKKVTKKRINNTARKRINNTKKKKKSTTTKNKKKPKTRKKVTSNRKKKDIFVCKQK